MSLTCSIHSIRQSESVLPKVPRCRYHPHTDMQLVRADIPLWDCFSQITKRRRHDARQIWRCPNQCPWVEPVESESPVSANDRKYKPDLDERFEELDEA